jgi:LAO/AO transport system kinase
MKAGLLEIADIFVVNKADRDGADRIKTELDMMLQLRPSDDGWTVPVTLTVATDGRGIEELVAAIEAHRTFLRASGVLAARTARGRREEFLATLREEIGRRVDRSAERGGLAALVAQVQDGSLDPDGAVLRVLGDTQLLESMLVDGEGERS